MHIMYKHNKKNSMSLINIPIYMLKNTFLSHVPKPKC